MALSQKLGDHLHKVGGIVRRDGAVREGAPLQRAESLRFRAIPDRGSKSELYK